MFSFQGAEGQLDIPIWRVVRPGLDIPLPGAFQGTPPKLGVWVPDLSALDPGSPLLSCNNEPYRGLHIT
jgi:hypothetical protein